MEVNKSYKNGLSDVMNMTIDEQYHDRNQRLYIASSHLMDASQEIAPLSTELAETFYTLANLMLEEMTISDKMTEEEMEAVMKGILDGK